MNDPGASYEDLKAGISPIAVDFSSQSDRLVVACGSMANARETPIFEFFATASHLDTNKIFIRDLRRAWYHRGLPGMGENIDDIAAHLDRLIKPQKFKHITFVGSSAGGYAAILFGFLLNADTVIAFSPKTFLDPWQRLLHFDIRTWRRMVTLLRTRSAQREYFDLQRVLQSRKTSTEFHVHFSADSRVDILHAEHLRDCANVALHRHAEGGHRLVKKLRNSGKLNEILLAALGGGS